MFAVEHLGVLSEDVTVFLDLQQGFLDELFVDWALRARVVVEGGAPFKEEFSNYSVVSVSQRFGSDALSYSFHFNWSAMRI